MIALQRIESVMMTNGVHGAQGDAIWLQVEGEGGGIFQGTVVAINGDDCDVTVQIEAKTEIPDISAD